MAILRRPNLARLVEKSLLAVPGIRQVQANPTTGRVLLFHDRSLDSREVSSDIRRRLGQLFIRVDDHQRSAAECVTAARQVAPARGRRRGDAPAVSPLLVASGGAAAALALGCGKTCLAWLAHPLSAVGIVAVATTAIVRRAWRRSSPRRSPRSAAGGNPYLRMVGPHRRRFAMASVLSVISQVVEQGMFAVVAFTLMTVVRGGSATLARVGLLGLPRQLTFLGGGIALASVLVLASSYVARVTWRGLGQDIEHRWRTDTYGHVQRMTVSNLEGERTSKVSRVVTEDVGQIGDFIEYTMHETVQLVTCFAVMVTACLVLAPQITWAAVAPIPLVTWLSLRYHERAAVEHETSGDIRANLHSQVVNSLQANQTIKASCTEEYEEQRIASLSEAYRANSYRTSRSSVFQTHLVRLGAGISMPGVAILGGRAVAKGALSIEKFAPLFEMPAAALWRLDRLGEVTDQHQRALAAFERVERLHALPTERREGKEQFDATNVLGDITLETVTFAYPRRPPALRKLSMQFAPGQVTGIVGTTGSGKTTIAKLLMRFENPDAGRILLDSVDVHELSLQNLRGVIGYVTQEPFLFDGTIAENIRYGTFEADQDMVSKAARRAGADTFIEAMPAGYDTKVGERGVTLSGGQRQRISLARTILNSPPIVILDEATSAVDYETEEAIRQALATFAHQRTMIVIAHRLSTVRDADLIYVLDKGGVLAEMGTHDELLDRGGRYASLWNIQMCGFRREETTTSWAPASR